MASNPSYGKYTSERTIFEDLVGAQFGSLPAYQEPPREPRPATFSSYSAPVELSPFVNVEMLIVPPRDATQEALNQWGRAGYLSRGLIADSRIREQEVLQQTVESKVNAIVNDEYERRRAVRRGVFEATGMTPAEIDERFAADVLRNRENAVTRATTDGQVTEALARYFTLRGGIVPAYLQPPPVIAPAVNNEAGAGGGGAAVGLPEVDADNVDPFAGIDGAGADPFAGLGGFDDFEPPAPLPDYAGAPAGAGGLTPAEWEAVIDLRATRGSIGAGSRVTKDILARFLVEVGALGVSGRPLTIASWKRMSLFELASESYRWLRDHPLVDHPDDLGARGGAGAPASAGDVEKGGVPLAAGGSGAGGEPSAQAGAGGGGAFLPPRGGADEGAVGGGAAAVDTAGDPLGDPRVRRKLRPAPAGGGGAPAPAPAPAGNGVDDLIALLRRDFEA